MKPPCPSLPDSRTGLPRTSPVHSRGSIRPAIRCRWGAFLRGMKALGWVPVVVVAGLLILSACAEFIAQCNTNQQCLDKGLPPVCSDGQCVEACSTAEDCNIEGTSCWHGGCNRLNKCSRDSDCAVGNFCSTAGASQSGRFCRPIPAAGCANDSDCAAGEICDTTTSPPACLAAASPVPACTSDFDCPEGEVCDQSAIPRCVPDDTGGGGPVQTVLEDTFDGDLFWLPSSPNQVITFEILPTGGNPGAHVEFEYTPSIPPFLMIAEETTQSVQPVEQSFSIDSIDFSIDVKVLQAATGLIGGEVAPYIRVVNANEITNESEHREYIGPPVSIRDDPDAGGWHRVSMSNLTPDDFCRRSFGGFDRDCSDPDDKPVFLTCVPGIFCGMNGGFFVRSGETSSDPVRLGVDNWRMAVTVTPAGAP